MMSTKDIVIECLKPYGVIIEDQIDEETLLSEYGMDSLLYMMFICDLEKKLSKEIIDYTALQFEDLTVAKLVKCLGKDN